MGKPTEETFQQRLVADCRIRYVYEEWNILVCPYDCMGFNSAFLLPIYCIAASTSKYLIEKALAVLSMINNGPFSPFTGLPSAKMGE